MVDGLCELMVGDHCQQLRHVSDAEDLFSILETWEDCMNGGGGGGGASAAAVLPAFSQSCTGGAVGARPTGSSRRRSGDEEKGGGGAPPVQKKQKGSALAPDGAAGDEGTAKMSHIAVERNRRKQMNEHLAVLRSLMPCFYVKRGDQASIIGGGVDYIKELQQLLRSLEAKMHRKAYAEHVLSPRLATAASPRPPPLSPRVAVPISPRTPTPGSPYKPGGGRPPHPASAAAAAAYMASSTMTPTTSSSYSYDQQQQHYSPQPYLPTLDSIVTELAARPLAAAGLLLPEVKVEFAGPNLVLKTVSRRAEGQALKIIAALESLSLEILHVSVITVDDTMVHSFTIKIGIECELSAEELVQKIHQTFS